MDYKKLGKRIREERLRLNLTQEKLSEEIGISTAYMGQIERGERSIALEKLIVLTNRLGVTVDFLLKDYLATANDDMYTEMILQLFDGRSKKEKELVVDIVRLLFAKR